MAAAANSFCINRSRFYQVNHHLPLKCRCFKKNCWFLKLPEFKAIQYRHIYTMKWLYSLRLTPTPFRIKPWLASLLIAVIVGTAAKAQEYYFPAAGSNQWDTLSPAQLGWCPSRIDSLTDYLQRTNTKAFIVLYQGKIVLEKYFEGHTPDSLWYWASAGKSLTAFLVGMAQQQGQVNIQQSVSHYLGNGWTVAPLAKESQISLRNLLAMNSGLNDEPPAPCNSLSTPKACLQYLADTGTRWGYHTGAYLQLHQVLQAVSGQGISVYTKNTLGDRIGMGGFWVNGVYVSNARSMARFGLLMLAKGRWGNDVVMTDTSYYRQMISPSQPLNRSYGYLWWLNGQPSFMVPGLQVVFNQPFIRNAPADMYAALGLNDQKIYVAPSRHLVVIRMGNSGYEQSAAISRYDDTIWQKINDLTNIDLPCTYTFNGNGTFSNAHLWQYRVPPPPALPASHTVRIQGECLLNQPLTLQAGSQLEVSPGSRLTLGQIGP